MTTERAELLAIMLPLEDFLNEPRRGGPQPEPIDTRDYRHGAYRVWSGVRDKLLAALTDAPRDREGCILAMMYALHSNVPEADRPTARMFFSDEQWARCEAAFDAALAPAIAPEGFVVVPREPTEAMLRRADQAFCKACNEDKSEDDQYRNIWSAMLAAAETAPPVSDGGLREALSKIEFPYQATFDAIAAAITTHPDRTSTGISVAKFQASLRAALSASEPVIGGDDK